MALTEDFQWELGLFATILALWERHADASLILIDVPIGLPEGPGGRRCDTEAKRLLGNRHSCVFPTPCRQAVYAETYREACEINMQQIGKSLSLQTWQITHRIREVDEFLSQRDNARRSLREMHPEICFYGLSGGRALSHSKKKRQGRLERRNVLNSIYPQSDEVIHAAKSNAQFRAV